MSLPSAVLFTFSCINCGWFCSNSHQRRPRRSSTPSSAAALTTVMPCYMASQIVNFSDCSLCRTLLQGWLLACGERSTSRRSWSLHWLPIQQQVTYKLATLVHKCINGRAPEYLAEFCHPSVDRRPGMRSADIGKLHVTRTQTSLGDRSFVIAGPRTWNNLPDAIRDPSLSFLTFAKLLAADLNGARTN